MSANGATVRVVADGAGELDVVAEPRQPDGDVERTASGVLAHAAVDVADDVDECLTDDQRARHDGAAQLSKSTEAYSRSLESWWWPSIRRIVPLLERMTSDCVVQPPER